MGVGWVGVRRVEGCLLSSLKEDVYLPGKLMVSKVKSELLRTSTTSSPNYRETKEVLHLFALFPLPPPPPTSPTTSPTPLVRPDHALALLNTCSHTIEIYCSRSTCSKTYVCQDLHVAEPTRSWAYIWQGLHKASVQDTSLCMTPQVTNGVMHSEVSWTGAYM